MQQQRPLIVLNSDTANAAVLPICDILCCFASEQKLKSINVEVILSADEFSTAATELSTACRN
jgi:hypothetical protein